MNWRACVWVVVAAVVAVACAPGKPSLEYEQGVVVASGVSGAEPETGWSEMLQVRTGDDPSAPLLLGQYQRREDRLVFTPRYPPAPGLTLRATLLGPGGDVADELVIVDEPEGLRATTRATGVYPSAGVWPENTLRLYIEFSAPMSAGYAYEHVQVVDEAGVEIIDPFVEIEPELWSRDQTRLTILFDPGRVKRGLIDNEESGPPLISGRMVTLVVDPAWPDASGAPLEGGLRKAIAVGDSIRDPVDVASWSLTPPQDSSAALTVRFPVAMDAALASRMIEVRRGEVPTRGDVDLTGDGMVWSFTPVAPWSPGRYTLHVDGRIEDVAGNRLGRAFDVDRLDPTQSREADAFAELTFAVP